MLLVVSVPLITLFSVIALWPLCLHCLVVFAPSLPYGLCALCHLVVITPPVTLSIWH